MEGMRFGTRRERRQVAAALTRIFRTKTQGEWNQLLSQKDTCTTPVLTVGEALSSDWGKALSVLLDVAGETVLNGPLRSKPPVRGRAFTKAPSLGKDTYALMRSMGYSRGQIQALRGKGAIE